MIPKIVPRRAYHRKDLGAFAAAIDYAGEKASCVATRNIVGTWHNAAHQMRTTAKLGRRQTCRVLYHISLSWPEQERPSDLQMFDAADHVIAALGAQDHEAVLAIHDDTSRRHIHIVLSRFHMATGRLLPTSNDFAKLERACREIEVAQGWSADRGRFDVRIDDRQNVTLVPKPQSHWKRKAALRAEGRRPQGDGERRRGRGSLTQPLSTRLGAAMKDRIRKVLDTARTWTEVAGRLGEIGLSLRSFRNGARLHIDHAGDHMRASDLGSGYSRGKLTERLGDIPPYAQHRPKVHLEKSPAKLVIEGRSDVPETELFPTHNTRTGRRSQSFARITANEEVFRQVRRIALQDVPRRIALVDGTRIEDLGAKIIATSADTPAISAFIMMTLAFEHGWTSVRATGPDNFRAACVKEGKHLGVEVEGVDAPTATSIADAATTSLVQRAEQKARNDTERAQVAAQKRRIKEEQTEAQAAIEAVYGTSRAPIVRALRGVLKAHYSEELAAVGDVRKSNRPLAPLDGTAIATAYPKLLKLRRKKEIERQFTEAGTLDHTSIRQLLEYTAITQTGKTSDPSGADSRAFEHPLLGELLPHVSSSGATIGYERATRPGSDPFVPRGRRGLGILFLPPEPSRALIFASFRDILRAASKMDSLGAVGLISIAGQTPSLDAENCLRGLEDDGYQLEEAPLVEMASISGNAEADAPADEPDDDFDDPGLMPW